MRELETGNLERVRGLAPFQSVTGVREIEGYLERVAFDDVRPTAGQKTEVVNELAGEGALALTLGDPGTAKTYTLNIIERFNEEVLLPEGRGHFSINAACTGKAAWELGLATGRPAFTVDSILHGWEAFKFDTSLLMGELQRQNAGPIRLVVLGSEAGRALRR